MTARTPNGRAQELTIKLLIFANNPWSSNELTEIESLIESAISQAVNEFADEIVKLFPCKPLCSCEFDAVREKIFKLKAAYAKGEKGE